MTNPTQTNRKIENIGPSLHWAAVTKSDTTVLDNVRALHVGTGGNLVLTGQDGVVATFVVPDGAWLPVSPKHVKAATTASGIVAVY